MPGLPFIRSFSHGHIPYVTALGIGEAAVTTEDGTVRKAAANGGMLSESWT